VQNRLKSLKAYEKLKGQIDSGGNVSGLGIPRSVKIPLLAALAEDINRPIIYLINRSRQILSTVDELGFWNANTSRLNFPKPTPLFYENASWGVMTRRERMNALTQLALYHIPGAPKPEKPPLIVVPIRAVMSRTLPRREFIKYSKVIKVNMEQPPEKLQRFLVDLGYEPVETVLEAGQFGRRGGIMDIWPPSDAFPYRLDFFGDEIDSIRRFNPATQRTIDKVERFLVTPAREFISALGAHLVDEGQSLDEFHLPLIHPSPASILDYLPRNGLIVVEDGDIAQTRADEIETQAEKIRDEQIEAGILDESYPMPYLSWSEVFDIVEQKGWIDFGHSLTSEDWGLEELFRPGERFGGRLKPFMDHLVNQSRRGGKFFIVSRQASRLKELWSEQGPLGVLPQTPQFIEGTLSDGWVLTDPEGEVYHLYTDSEVFGWERPKPRSRQKVQIEAPEANYADLNPGDWVVHVDFGIGQYSGLIKRTLEGAEREFLCIEYDAGDQLFVPVHQADRLSPFVGPDNRPPKPTRLGTIEWQNTKDRVRKQVIEVAEDLLALYAKRQLALGYAFKPDTPWQQELEASFPYVETEDQLEAILQVKRDMESSRPMDRLLCGDVGYGKTEVALRAAFKAVMEGKQVALLVPTTVLAQQHYDTFRERLMAFPVEVEMLSRFRKPKAQDQIIDRLTKGEVDIIIGTHRLISKDVNFKDLGLLIIDEEQRFGVVHKEHLKKMRTEVDVLTLTATPIPRTLYMALTGARDISVINTPPEERLPIVTQVGPYAQNIVRQAVLRELERGGQVFFVHNRVQSIDVVKQHLLNIVPEARIGVGHGQMPEDQLSAVMHQFTKGDIDILLCTSIIESGLDIPNANTLIVDRADTFGLAQLYQLRGRVGRGANRAYAYFFRHRSKTPTPEGLERLDIIAENTQLGAGYSIAMRDLEMRGAGDLLGMRQHGYIASVGFHLYTSLLSEAVTQLRKAKGLPQPADEVKPMIKPPSLPVSVDLPISVGIPGTYVEDQNQRLKLYRRLANVGNNEELEKLIEEFLDRFGEMPEPVLNLFYQLRIKLLAEKIGLASVNVESDQIILRYPPLPEGIKSRNLKPLGPSVRVGKNGYWVSRHADGSGWEKRLISVLRELA
jgi:transcription-repair coupling factor (superfamily II helicase)